MKSITTPGGILPPGILLLGSLLASADPLHAQCKATAPAWLHPAEQVAPILAAQWGRGNTPTGHGWGDASLTLDQIHWSGSAPDSALLRQICRNAMGIRIYMGGWARTDSISAGRHQSDAPWAPPRSLPGGFAPALEGIVTLPLTESGSVHLRASYLDSLHIEEAHLTARWRQTRFWAGRRTTMLGHGASGSLVFNPRSPLPGFGAAGTIARLPGPLRHLGPARWEALLARPDSVGSVASPNLIATRLVLHPHANVALGATRAAYFGAPSVSGPLRLSDLVGALVGEVSAGNGKNVGFENQVASLDLRLRGGADVAWTLAAEWAMEDAAGAWWDVPARRISFGLPDLPHRFSTEVEWTHLSASCCGNPPWYRHAILNGGWTLNAEPLGHPIGGNGWQALLRVSQSDAAHSLHSELFVREYGSENLFAPERAGRSIGATFAGQRFLQGGERIRAEGRLESGTQGLTAALQAGIYLRP